MALRFFLILSAQRPRLEGRMAPIPSLRQCLAPPRNDIVAKGAV